MNKTVQLFDQILNVLLLKFPDMFDYSEEHNVKYLKAKDSDFWISNEFGEIIVGFGANHSHFSEDFGNLENVKKNVLDLLTQPIKTTYYLKGNTIYKTILEIVDSEKKSSIIGSSKLLFFPFWKKTKIEVEYSKRILDETIISKDFEEILITPIKS